MADTAQPCIVRVRKIIFQNRESGYTIFSGLLLEKKKRGVGLKDTKKTRTVLGVFQNLCLNDTIEITGRIVQDEFYGEQFHASGYQRIHPGTMDELRKFFLSHYRKIGPARIDQLLEQYGLDAISEIIHDSSVLTQLGLSAKKAQEIRDAIVEDQSFEDLMAFLQLYELDSRYAMPLFKEYKDQAVARLKQNPYAAYESGIISFPDADDLYCRFGGDQMAEVRVSMSVYAFLCHDAARNGNLFVPMDTVTPKCNLFLKYRRRTRDTIVTEFPEELIKTSISKLEASGLVTVDSSLCPGNPSVYLAENYRNETNIVTDLFRVVSGSKRYAYDERQILDFLSWYETVRGIELAPEQKDAVVMAMTSPVSILTGGPGTGKTQTVNAIIAAVEACSQNAKIKLAAPTGKAANRMAELTGKPAMTIHRMLGLGSFFVSSVSPGELDADFLIVDEFSMADAELACRLFQAASPQTRVLIVGDFDQLPSVGPGLVLRDLIRSGCFPCVRLTRIFRQAHQSGIVCNAHAIISQENLKFSDDFQFVDAVSPQNIQQKILAALADLERKYGSGNVQVLSPLKEPDIGVNRLNVLLQESRNPNGAPYLFQDGEFRVGDRVIQTVNNYSLNVFNGECGIVKAIDYLVDKTLLVSYPDRDIWYGVKDLPQLDLAYAISVHKAQGSEFPVVIMPIHESLAAGLNRNLLYTAVTRAKEKVVLIGSRAALDAGLKKEATCERNSNLAERIRGAFARRAA